MDATVVAQDEHRLVVARGSARAAGQRDRSHAVGNQRAVLRQHQQLVDPGHVIDADRTPEAVAEVVVDLPAVGPRQDDAAQPAAVRGEHLLGDAPDGEHLSAEGDLAGHRHVGTDRTACEGAHQRGGQRHAGQGPLLRRVGRLDVQVYVGVALEVRVEADTSALSRTLLFRSAGDTRAGRHVTGHESGCASC